VYIRQNLKIDLFVITIPCCVRLIGLHEKEKNGAGVAQTFSYMNDLGCFALETKSIVAH
jgi:hypothetical protein